MGGWISAVICASATFLLFRGQHYILAAIMTATLFVNFWSFGVMHNFAVSRSYEKMKRLQQHLANTNHSPEQQEALDRLKLKEIPEDIPDWLARVNLVSTLTGLLALIGAIMWA